MPKQRKSRVYTRQRGGVNRHYADFRDFTDVGGKQEALIADGERSATTDPDIAAHLASERVQVLEAKRHKKTILGVTKETTLAAFAAHHLIAKKQGGKVTDDWLEYAEKALSRAINFLGAERDLESIKVEDVRQWNNALHKTPNGRGGMMSSGTVRHNLNSLSNLFRRAISEGFVQLNPVAGLMEKPVPNCQEAQWLEIPDAALLLEAARLHRDLYSATAYPLIGTFLLTGGRCAEVLGLEVNDVSFDRQTITLRPNQWRRLKTKKARRSVPLWPQLEEILRPYVFGADGPPGTLLFPSRRMKHMENREAMISDFRKLLDSVAVQAGWDKGDIRSKQFRHTYCAARLQTLDAGKPVSQWTVATELGHKTPDMISEVYGHLGTFRHRTEVVEYRVEQHSDVLGERLSTLHI
jgi:integrase